MDLLTFVANVIGALAWPATTLIVVVMLKDHVTPLLPFLKRLKAGPVEANFEREVEQLESEVRALPAAAEALPPSVDQRRNELMQIAAISPRAAVFDAWQGVDWAVKRAAIQRIGGSPMPDVATSHKAARLLQKAGVITGEELALFNDLRGLRNQAVHVPEATITYESAMKYIDLATQLQTKFERLAALE